MLVSEKHIVGIVGIVSTTALVLGVGLVVADVHVSPSERVAVCNNVVDTTEQIDCLYGTLNERMQASGIAAAMEVFEVAYEQFYSFASTGCHLHAHRVGDMAYYGLYLQDGLSLADMEFPQNTSGCGYGFFHGFTEHLIQDNPDPAFVTQTCEYLSKQLGGRMGDIGITCYHGSGHGFTLHQSERVSAHRKGDIMAFTREPIAACESLSKATQKEIEECRQGVFNVIVQWMEDEDYGFIYNREDPFAICNTLNAELHHACYYEMAQKLNTITNNDPRQVAEVVRKIEDKDLQRVSFGVGIAGIVQQTIADGSWMTKTVPQCLMLDDPFLGYCIGSVVQGLFEHGPPREEYKKPLALCQRSEVFAQGADEICYQNIGRRLDRFYDSKKAAEICARIPGDSRKHCNIIEA